ncbi:CBASS cGAMP-activated phospholipase [Acinetobacter guerrae]|uniref:CBASS cGAMP-activated phospholipase n=1 Tax=Acinetobacter guerrae TaxID=1843371 RepID=UPI00125F696F|nr:CBASS cGAMP-activated phospholipase [Acinetobacter guerrae]
METYDNNRNIKILSLNGGGVRGLFTISLLAELESIIEEREGRIDVKIGDYFDLITGTSIGGILALGLASGQSARDLRDTFKENAQSIFPSHLFKWKKVLTLFRPIYNSEPLREAVTNMIPEDMRFNDLQRRVMVTSVNLSTGLPKFFKTPHNPMFTLDGKLKLVDAAMATSAAPTYFKPHYCSDLNHYFADGGLVSNNPSLVGIREVLIDMKSDFPDAQPKDVKILNVGTLSENYCISPKVLEQNCGKGYHGLWNMGERLVLTTMTANQHLQRFMLMREFNVLGIPQNYVELDATIPNEASSDITLDNASGSSLDALIGLGKKLGAEAYTERAELRHFFEYTAEPFINKSIKLGDQKV